MSIKKWNTWFVILVPVGAAIVFWLTQLLVGAHMRLLNWVAMFVWLIASQVWQNRAVKQRNQALDKLWQEATARHLDAAALHAQAPQYTAAQWAQTAPGKRQFFPALGAIATLTATISQQPVATKRHRK